MQSATANTPMIAPRSVIVTRARLFLPVSQSLRQSKKLAVAFTPRHALTLATMTKVSSPFTSNVVNCFDHENAPSAGTLDLFRPVAFSLLASSFGPWRVLTGL